MKPTWNNYKIAFKQVEDRFLSYDQELIIRESNLRADDDYIYVTYFNSPYRIDRKSGYMERNIGNDQWRHCSFNEGMGIFDVICDPTPFRSLCGEMVDTGYFAKMGYSGHDISQPFAERFSEDLEKFKQVCLDLGGVPYGKSDAGFMFQAFDFLPIALQLWEGEEGIPPALRFLWDKNLHDFIRFETSYIIINHLMVELNTAMGFENDLAIAEHAD